MRPGIVILALWIAWVLSWLVAARWSGATEKRPGFGAELGYRITQLVGAFLLFVPTHNYDGPLRVWHIGWDTAWVCVVLVALGFVFCWWARIHLGQLWSSSITRKVNHKVIDSGPYAIVRHPMYTGILLAVLATTATKGTIPAIAGALLMVLAIGMKARLEERWLSQELGAGAYDTYRRKVPMLVPLARKPRIT